MVWYFQMWRQQCDQTAQFQINQFSSLFCSSCSGWWNEGTITEGTEPLTKCFLTRHWQQDTPNWQQDTPNPNWTMDGITLKEFMPMINAGRWDLRICFIYETVQAGPSKGTLVCHTHMERRPWRNIFCRWKGVMQLHILCLYGNPADCTMLIWCVARSNAELIEKKLVWT